MHQPVVRGRVQASWRATPRSYVVMGTEQRNVFFGGLLRSRKSKAPSGNTVHFRGVHEPLADARWRKARPLGRASRAGHAIGNTHSETRPSRATGFPTQSPTLEAENTAGRIPTCEARGRAPPFGISIGPSFCTDGHPRIGAPRPRPGRKFCSAK